MHTIHEEIVFAEAEDGLSLVGLALKPTAAPPPSTAIVLVHGNTGRFYDWLYVQLGRALAEAGYFVISGNTRGHDISTWGWNGQASALQAVGSAWERFEEAPHDIAGWVGYAASMGASRVVLFGHSQGAAKAVIYQAQRHDPQVLGVVAASPDLNSDWGTQAPAARALVAEGRGGDFLQAAQDDPWYRLTAANIVSRADCLAHVYRSDQQAPAIAALGSPLLVLFGSNDIGGEAEAAAIRQGASSAPRVDTAIIEGADHLYSGREQELASRIGGWVGTLV
ncbi:MAG TPA: alpha/beta fold hydrolase [Roseiflexaceae bacterium]|nr:alpha/beta fold hydrolase [Roseiflexaceae bacterium]